tara:strand:+ start:172 stop:408 length:237 start_codon:yes stop_codon:yes gene_type:complete
LKYSFKNVTYIIYINLKMKKNYLKIIKEIENVRSKNNVNWMNILRLAFKLDPVQASKIMKKINYDDKKISKLLSQLSK